MGNMPILHQLIDQGQAKRYKTFGYKLTQCGLKHHSN